MEIKFEGQYLNGERWNGKGKEYLDDYGDKLIFDGEYLNGKKWNGKRHIFDVILIFQCKYLNGELKIY